MISISTAQVMHWLGLHIWPFVRIMALFAAAPVFSHRSIPARTKIALSVLIAIVVAPMSANVAVYPLDSPDAVRVLIHELLVGISLGFAMKLTVSAIELAGELMGLQMGLSFAAFFDPQGGVTETPVGSWFGIIALLLLLAINGHLLMLSAVTDSFRHFPIGPHTDLPLNLAQITNMGGDLFLTSLHIALPVIAVILVTNLAIGIMTRVAPQMNLPAVGAPVGVTVGLGAVFVITPYLEMPMTRVLERGLAFIGG
jgi:flagellar biosynthetic protein FliR